MSEGTYWTRLLERIESQYIEDDECWLWLGRSSRNGYGRISVQGKERQVHRVLYAIEHGPLGDGVVLDHLCRNRHCVNPAHMEPVTIRVNTLRGEGPTAQRWGGDDGELWSQRAV